MVYTHDIGMKFWRTLDQRTQYDDDFMSFLTTTGAFSIQADFMQTRKNGTYPVQFKQKFVPLLQQWQRVAQVQAETVSDVLGNDGSNISGAFEDFGQGILLDTDPVRQQSGDGIHMMDRDEQTPPVGYHRWHALSEPFSFSELAINNGGSASILFWASPGRQTKTQQVANQAIAANDLQDLRDAWLIPTPEQRDQQYDLDGLFRLPSVSEDALIS